MFLWSVFTHVLLPILVIVGFGWLIDRRSRLDLSTLVKLNIYLFVPAFIFVHVVGSNLSGGAAARIMGFTACIIASMFLLSALVGRGLGYEPGHNARPATGHDVLQLGQLRQSRSWRWLIRRRGRSCKSSSSSRRTSAPFTVGLALAAATHRSGWRLALPMLRQISLWAVLSAVTVRFFHLPVQEVRWLWVPLQYLSEGLVAFALITLGVQLSQTRARQNLSRLGWALGLRLLVGPAHRHPRWFPSLVSRDRTPRS
ncbi:MAG: hypothetical protein WDN28_23900 [Chthoniobacter sp.]